MISFKSTLAILLVGSSIQFAMSMEGTAAPHLTFEVIEMKDNEARLHWETFPTTITGAINKETKAMALGRTYDRATTLKETLQKNHLEYLEEALIKSGADMDKIKYKQGKAVNWQIMYIGQKNSEGQFMIEGIGFIQGDMNIQSPHEQPIYYISTRLSHELPRLEALKHPGHLVMVEISDEEIRRKVSNIASKYYPRYICMQDEKVCLAGHGALAHLAWKAKVHVGWGTLENSYMYYGFTLIKNATLVPHTMTSEHTSAAATSTTDTHVSTKHEHPSFIIDPTTTSSTPLPLNNELYEEVRRKLSILLGDAEIIKKS